jgi:hypothetical protein
MLSSNVYECKPLTRGLVLTSFKGRVRSVVAAAGG